MARLRTVKVDRLSLFEIKAKPMLERSIAVFYFICRPSSVDGTGYAGQCCWLRLARFNGV